MEKYSGRIYGLALSLTRNEDDAEDVLQETFLTVMRKLDTFEGRSSIYTWMHRIAANIALGKLRRQAAAPDVDISPEDFQNLATQLPEQWRTGDLFTGESPEYVREAIDKAAADLPENQRLVFLLRDVEGLSTRDTAEALGLTPSNVKVRLMRAHIQLRNRLAHIYRPAEGQS